MKKITVFLLILSISILAFGQDIDREPEGHKQQALIDAQKDAENTHNDIIWGGIGGAVSCLGAGCLSLFSPISLGIWGPLALSSIACLGTGLISYLINPSIPYDKLYSMEGDYASLYTNEFRNITKSKRLTSALIGGAIGSLLNVAFYFYILSVYAATLI